MEYAIWVSFAWWNDIKNHILNITCGLCCVLHDLMFIFQTVLHDSMFILFPNKDNCPEVLRSIGVKKKCYTIYCDINNKGML